VPLSGGELYSARAVAAAVTDQEGGGI